MNAEEENVQRCKIAKIKSIFSLSSKLNNIYYLQFFPKK